MAFTGRPGPVVVGVDYSAGGAAALSYAAWEAQRRGAGLKLIHGFVATDPGEALPTAPYDDNELVVAAEERLAEAAVAHLSPGFPRSLVTTKVVAGSGGSALVDESLRAGLVVVGARGLGGFDGLLLGSVAVQVSKHSRCPVVVVRSSAGPDAAPGRKPVLVGVDGSPRPRGAEFRVRRGRSPRSQACRCSRLVSARTGGSYHRHGLVAARPKRAGPTGGSRRSGAR